MSAAEPSQRGLAGSPVRLGLLRLVDSAPPLLAASRGLFDRHGVAVEISIEPSWANLADKLSYGLLDAAVMLPPLALAAALGLRGPPARLIVPLGTSQGGNTIVLSAEAATAAGMEAGEALPPPAAGALLLAWLRAQPSPPRFAVVHAYSTHNLLLRYWLAAIGGDPDRDIETVVVPPEDVVAALAAGGIAGFCAGAPWGGHAEVAGAGRVLLGTSSIWPLHPEKCLAMAEGFAQAAPSAVAALLGALLAAQALCDQPEEAPALAALLARPDGLALPEAACRAVLAGGSARERIRFHAGAAWFPATAHARWFLGQMRRWGWVDAASADLEALARQVYRPDLLNGVVGADTLPPNGDEAVY